jgi:hypothetical protein
VLELVQQQVRYIYVGLDGGNYKPATADETWTRRYGDCKAKTALLLALLRELGIEAEPVLANNSGTDDGLDARLPSPGMFNHVLVRARIDGASYWLDGTLPPVARADTRPALPYRWVLPLAANGQQLEAVPWKPASQPDLIQVYEMDASAGFDKPARIALTTIQRGIKGLAEYVQLSAVTKDQLVSAFRGQLTGGSNWNAVDSVDYRYDPVSHASILKITGAGPVDWQRDGAERSLSVPGGGFYPPERRQRAPDQDQQAPYYDDPTYTCYVTTVRLPADTVASKWSYNTSINTVMYGRRFYRTWHRDDGAIQMIRGSRTEELEVPAAEAQRDNTRLAAFDNSNGLDYVQPQRRRQLRGGEASACRNRLDFTDRRVPACGRCPLKDALDPALELALGRGAKLLGDRLTVLEQDHQRDRLHADLPGNVGIGHDVHLGDGDLVGQLIADLLECRGDHLARPAPLGPEVDQHRLVRLEDIRLESGIGDGLGGHEGCSCCCGNLGVAGANATLHPGKLSCGWAKAGLGAASNSAGSGISCGVWV